MVLRGRILMIEDVKKLRKEKTKMKGTCTMCGKKRELTVVDEVTEVCQDCLDNEFIQCDECRQYWLYDAIKFYHLKDGRTLCEDCAEDIDDEDEIDFIEDHT
jgi:predicted RNA-binding Zn-ribbon protein involved in translation (DUF1610 family)